MKKLFVLLCCFLCLSSGLFAAVTIENSTKTYDSFGDFLFDVTISLLWLENSLVYYDDYPFANGDYIIYGDPVYGALSGTSSRYTVETSAFWFPKTGIIGNETRFDSIIHHHFGPQIENRMYYNPETNTFTGDVKIGCLLTIFQTNPLSMSLVLDYNHLYGDLNENGIAFGVVFKSYINRFAIVEWRLMASDLVINAEHTIDDFDTDSIMESHFEIGFMAAPHVELFGAVKGIADGFHLWQDTAVTVGGKLHY